MKTKGLRAKSWRQRSCVGIEGEEVAGQVDVEGKDNLEAPGLKRYIATVRYIF
jgi:hypothetical protein